jgi:hypothetical protein
MKKTGLHTLKLVFTPFSNQEGEWFRNDDDVRAIARESNLYMIGHRPEVLFENLVYDERDSCFTFDLHCRDLSMQRLSMPISQFPSPDDQHDFYFELGPKFMRISHIGKSGDPATRQVVHWFTPDRLFHYFSRGDVEVNGMQNCRPFTTYNLYYVGISKRGDSFSRLFKTAHENRSRILGNETQCVPTARLTDELMLFLFKVEDLQIVTYGEEDFPDDDTPFEFQKPIASATLAADAEKAFVNIMKTKYNTEQYEKYPRSTDGLWSHNFVRYGFVIEEHVSFTTQTETIRGGLIYKLPEPEPADMIVVEGDTVTLLKCD